MGAIAQLGEREGPAESWAQEVEQEIMGDSPIPSTSRETRPCTSWAEYNREGSLTQHEGILPDESGEQPLTEAAGGTKESGGTLEKVEGSGTPKEEEGAVGYLMWPRHGGEETDLPPPEWNPYWDRAFVPVMLNARHRRFREAHPEYLEVTMWERGPCPKGRCFQCREAGHWYSQCPNPALFEYCTRCGWPHERLEWCRLCAPKYWARQGKSPPPRPTRMWRLVDLQPPSEAYMKWARRSEEDLAKRRQ